MMNIKNLFLDLNSLWISRDLWKMSKIQIHLKAPDVLISSSEYGDFDKYGNAFHIYM